MGSFVYIREHVTLNQIQVFDDVPHNVKKNKYYLWKNIMLYIYFAILLRIGNNNCFSLQPVHWRTLKTQTMKEYFLHPLHFVPSLTDKKRVVTTLCFYLYPIPVILKALATTNYASLIYYVLHVVSPRINEAKYCIISHVACKYTCIKTQKL